MSLEITLAPRRPGAAGELAAAAPVPAAVEFHYTQTESFVAVLRHLGTSLLVSTYQANKLLAVRAQTPGPLTIANEEPNQAPCATRLLFVAPFLGEAPSQDFGLILPGAIL